MAELWNDYPALIVVTALAILLFAFLRLRPRQRVTLDSETPRRPHMANEGKILADGNGAAPRDPSGQIVSAKVKQELPGASGPPDDLHILKGVGPKMAILLNERGLTRFDQIAKLSAGQVETLDESLGAFRGRLRRDRIVEQAEFLARGDRDGYEAKFGKL